MNFLKTELGGEEGKKKRIIAANYNHKIQPVAFVKLKNGTQVNENNYETATLSEDPQIHTQVAIQSFCWSGKLKLES